MSNNDDRRHEGIGFRGLTNYRAPSESEIQAGISASMRDVIQRDTRNVHDRGSPATPTTERARGTMGAENGWVEPAPLGLQPGIELIDRLCDQLLPHAPGYKPKGEPKSETK